MSISFGVTGCVRPGARPFGATWSRSGFKRFKDKLIDQKRDETKITNVRSLVSAIKVWVTKYYCGLMADPLDLLLYCNNNRGRFLPEECKAMAPRLRRMVTEWHDKDCDKMPGLELARTMEQYAAKREILFY